VAEPCFAVGAADGGGEAGPGAQLAGAREPGDVADLGDDQHRGGAADATDLAEHLDVGILARARLDLDGGCGDLAVEVGDQREQAVQPPPWRLAQLELGQEAAPARAEQVAVGARDPVLGQDRPDPLLQRRAHPGERDPVAEQITQLAQLTRRDVGLRQQIGAEQVRERPGVDRVGLDPR
jgi:hypothetical protein